MSERNGAAVKGQKLPPDVEQATRFKPVPYLDLVPDHSRLREPVIDGVLRRGETMNIIAPPKSAKTWLVLMLAWCIATGRHWLGHQVRQGRVLIADNELHVETLVHRLNRIADALEIPHDEREGIDIVSLRGRLASIAHISALLDADPDHYRLIIVDALYRTIPEKVSENDNAGMMTVYNHIDAIAERTGAAVAVIHHSSKGQQGDKALTDMGAGAGAIARAADTHLAIREHETPGHFVLEAVTRSFKSPDPVSVQFAWPLWEATTLAPEIKRVTRQDKARQDKSDTEGKQAILKAIPEGKRIVQADLRQKTGFGAGKLQRLTSQMVNDGAIVCEKKRKKGGRQKYVFYSLPASRSESCSESCSESD